MSLSDSKLFRNDIQVKIYSNRLRQNVANLRSLCSRQSKFCAVVKANAYGHGIVEVVDILKDEAVDFFAVAHYCEALGIKHIIKPHQNIIIFEPLNPTIEKERLIEYCQSGFHYSLCDIFTAKHISSRLKNTSEIINVHINIETGMGRLGAEPALAIELLEFVDSCPNIEIKGVYTHFATADEDDLSFAYEQLDNFNRFLTTAQIRKRNGVIIHCANSAATMKMPESHFDMVRCGIAMYGYYSRSQKHPSIELSPVMELQAPIVHLKRIPAGRSVSYGRSYWTKRDTLSAIIPFGYADGYLRIFSNKAMIKVAGSYAPVIGRVCMDQIMADVTDIEGVKVGDWATLIDNDHKSPAGAYGLADIAGTICYEILISLHKHLRRVVV